MRRYKTKEKVFLVFLLMALLCGCQHKDSVSDNNTTRIVLTTGFSEDEVFRIGDSSCSKAEIMVYLTNMQNQYESVFGTKIWDRSIEGETLETKVKNMVLSRIAKIKTMNLLAKERGVTLSEDEKNRVSMATEEYYNSLNETEITSMGVTKEMIQNLYQEYALAGKVYDTVIRDTNPEISDDEARKVTVSQILIKTFAMDGNGNRTEYTEESKKAAYEKAQAILQKIKNGEEFDILAARYNEGEQTTLSFGKGEKEQIYEDAAFNLGNEEISGIVETADGYVIIKCLSTLDREQTDENKKKIVEERKMQTFNEIYDAFLEKQLRNLNEDLWNQLTFIRNNDVKTNSFFEIYNKYFEFMEN